MIQVGQKFKLQKCKHRFNNGLVVEIVEVNGADNFIATNISTNEVTDETGFKYNVGIKNLGVI